MSNEKRPSLREAARRGVEAKQPAQASQPPAQPAPAPVAKAPAAMPQRPKPPVVGVEHVVVRCGHTAQFELFDPKKDKYRDARRKKLTDADCRDCRVKAQEERTRAEMEAARLLRAQKPPKPRKEWTPAGAEHRLPDGSRFDVAYDAAKGEWSGTLAVPGTAPFPASASGVFKLLRVLDGMFRAVLPPVEAEASPEPPSGNGRGAHG